MQTFWCIQKKTQVFSLISTGFGLHVHFQEYVTYYTKNLSLNNITYKLINFLNFLM